MLRCAACATRSVDKLVGRGRLFKRAIILIKAWCYNESRILGSHHGLIAECSTPSFSRTRRTTNGGSIDAARPAVLTHARTHARSRDDRTYARTVSMRVSSLGSIHGYSRLCSARDETAARRSPSTTICCAARHGCLAALPLASAIGRLFIATSLNRIRWLISWGGPVPEQMWVGWAQSRCRCGRGGPSPGADVGGVGPVPAPMWPG